MMTIKIKLIWVGVAFMVLTLGAYFLGGIKPRRDRDNVLLTHREVTRQLKDTLSSYKEVIDEKAKIIFEQRTIIMRKEQAIQSEIISKEKYKKLHIREVRENVRLLMDIEVLKDSLKTVSSDTIVIHDTLTDSYNTYLRLPSTHRYQDDYVSLTTNINEDASWGFNLRVPLDVNVTLGSKKTGWFSSEPTVFLIPEGPYINNVRVQSVHIKKESRFYETLWWDIFTHGASFVAGYYLGGR